MVFNHDGSRTRVIVFGLSCVPVYAVHGRISIESLGFYSGLLSLNEALTTDIIEVEAFRGEV